MLFVFDKKMYGEFDFVLSQKFISLDWLLPIVHLETCAKLAGSFPAKTLNVRHHT